ncbi:PHP domain protein [Natrialba magadii ATCC 43099]|uniref:histidinol-phosphatase n=1 Tax=Natrialba magadii (strain ATCC 43099 / DSM 3394 / CCM 3739 / CIP 104546 / IAM 13178 / JCM 8861 / NBRC 102185 / NCIMB 2190 / MS3) TaxID=547559 RepID=D3SXJ8_NATMM|nr:PHP domain-containing protein [Natrialba magadii]ADD05947.1 PHP domain protein [Natrialba magadii ATCC 43099]ELY30545.1 PHP domain-containing protein [Natrialba magadii ATCC 43099]
MHDFHVHSNYSDGSFLRGMVRAAESADLDGIGFADHCNVADRTGADSMRTLYGFNLDLTYERRREGIERVREETSVSIYDAVEMDYNPRDETKIEAFLDDAGFDYSIGSVHTVDGDNVQIPSAFTERTDDELNAVVDDYFDTLVSLIESELFDIAAHVDLIERTPPLRGRATTDHYRRVAQAFADSSTIPELNAGRALTDAEIVHPSSAFLSTLREYDVPVTIGSDSHRPGEIGKRATFLEEYAAELGLEPVSPSTVLES